MRPSAPRSADRGRSYLDGSYLFCRQRTGMCKHKCIHGIRRTDTTSDGTTEAVSSSKEHVSQGANRVFRSTNPIVPILS